MQNLRNNSSFYVHSHLTYHFFQFHHRGVTPERFVSLEVFIIGSRQSCKNFLNAVFVRCDDTAAAAILAPTRHGGGYTSRRGYTKVIYLGM